MKPMFKDCCQCGEEFPTKNNWVDGDVVCEACSKTGVSYCCPLCV